jgi:predicted phosphodiesterase
VLSLVFTLVNYISSTIAYAETAAIYIVKGLPWLLAFFSIPFLLLVYPNLKIPEKRRKIFAWAISLIFVLGMAVPVFGQVPFLLKFTSEPIVLDTGTGYYSVVFAVNDNSHGFVRYTYDGAEKTVFSQDAGVKRIAKIHAVQIPREELENNSYTVSATRVLQRLSYQNKSSLGKTITGKIYNFKGDQTKKDPRIVSASDWHHYVDGLEKSAANFENVDLYLLMGDYADFYVNEDWVVKFFLKGAAVLTKSETPAIFVRGNHEVRADYDLQDLWRVLGLPGFYYQVRRGNYLFTVLDSVEEHEGRGWREHDGFYDIVPYLHRQMDWFETLEIPKDAYHIVLTHDTDFNSESSGARARYFDILSKQDVRLTVSGHSHSYKVTRGPSGAYTRLEDGGKNTLNGPNGILDIFHVGTPVYCCSLLEFSGDAITVTARDVNGSPVLGWDLREDPSVESETFILEKYPAPVAVQ